MGKWLTTLTMETLSVNEEEAQAVIEVMDNFGIDYSEASKAKLKREIKLAYQLIEMEEA
jgi:hypothetical protein